MVTQTAIGCTLFPSLETICDTQRSPSGCDATTHTDPNDRSGMVQGSDVEAIPQDDEGLALLNGVKKSTARMTHFFWHVPDSGYPKGYLPRTEYFKRLEVCLASDDMKRRSSVIAEMRGRLT